MTIPPSSLCLPISWSGGRGEARGGGRRHHGARRGPPRDRARTRARDAARARAVRGGRPTGRHHRDGAARGLSRGARPRLVSLREALGPCPLSPSRHRGPAHPHRRSLPPHLRRVRRPPPFLARGLPAPRPHSPRPFVRSGLFSWTGKLRMAMDLVLPRGADPDESLGAFVSGRLGREALERVAQPLVAGIYTADPD